MLGLPRLEFPIVRAIDLHVHLPFAEWLDGSLGPFREPAERYFRTRVAQRTADELAAFYEGLDTVGVLLGWDAETATGRPALANDLVAGLVERYPGRFVGLAGIDPRKGRAALDEMRRAREELGLAGYKFHPTMQAFRPDDPEFAPIFERAAAERAPCLFHTGTSGIGAGMPGGQGLELGYARPIHLDAVAARYPELPVVMAHFGWPWHLEAIAIAQHKANVWIEVSGWAPKRVPAEVVDAAEHALADRVVWGSDGPFFDAGRTLEGWAGRLSPEAYDRVVRGNAARLLNLDPVANADG
jgi:predicted TIM-barrel fold metal-dependent hydrolase